MAQNGPMRLLLLAATLGAACAAQAQVKPMIVRPPAEDRDERERHWHERDREDDRRWRGREERRETRPAKMAPPATRPAIAPMVVVPRPEPATPPSKAEEMQRQMQQQREQEREPQRRRERREPVSSSGNFRCTAYPVCERSSSSYGTCRGVEQIYSASSARFAREQVARDCSAINTPDPCNCAAQCSRVAQCGPI
jgi:hypothetical protein